MTLLSWPRSAALNPDVSGMIRILAEPTTVDTIYPKGENNDQLYSSPPDKTGFSAKFGVDVLHVRHRVVVVRPPRRCFHALEFGGQHRVINHNAAMLAETAF